MASKSYKQKADKLIKRAKEKGLITKYEDFLKTDLSKETALSEKEAAYYISKNKECFISK